MDKETVVRDSQTKATELEERLLDTCPKRPRENILPDKSSDPELLPRQITVRPEERKAMPILYTRLGSS